ncbi:NAD(P)H-dependent flavin oxidoreductase [Paracoccus tibetensis]|uniref:Nitronate monooxygenase n=1 Tax=Paracoccus tibetensis TaxID=336292 RepID=A0A1G5ECL8_9RHOB|nr:nitronate monooxygenase [Paracoccus tibetensis]SCY24712.1 nitronate monooxygenase [Paracoccus tibetensis]
MRVLDGLALPLLQAPMAGVATPALAAAVSEAGALGALGLGAAGAEGAALMIRQTQALTGRPFNVNLFCHAPAARDSAREAAWIARAAPLFAKFGATPPQTLSEIYLSFRQDDAMLRVLMETRPAVISFHFGLPRQDQLAALREIGATLIATATSQAEAEAIATAGLDGIVAQGWEAGGHRGIFEPAAPDERLTTEALVRRLGRVTRLPLIAAGGLMEGTDIRRALNWGAAAAQLGTAFIPCTESAADADYRARLAGGETVMTPAISGRPARCLRNRFTDWTEGAAPGEVAPYPCAYDLGKALNSAARAKGETGFGAHWSGTGAARARPMPAADLVARLAAEYAAA